MKKITTLLFGLMCLMACFFNLFEVKAQQDTNFSQAIELMDMGNEKEAKKYLDACIAANPKHAKAFFYRSSIAANEKNYSEALADMLKVCELEPQNFAYTLLAAEYQFNLNDFSTAKTSILAYLKKDKSSSFAYFLLAKTKKALGENDYCQELQNAIKFGSNEAAELAKSWCE